MPIKVAKIRGKHLIINNFQAAANSCKLKGKGRNYRGCMKYPTKEALIKAQREESQAAISHLEQEILGNYLMAAIEQDMDAMVDELEELARQEGTELHLKEILMQKKRELGLVK